MMAEIYGREDGLCKGRGGSMHIADFSRGMLGANAIVGGGIALATGAGARRRACAAAAQVAVAFFGDGAANQGVLHESLNLAAIWKLPVIYVCENNGFAESTPAAYATSVPDVASRAAAYGIPGVIADGADVVAVYEAAREAVGARPRGRGPDAARGEDLPLHGALRGRPRPLPRRRRARGAARSATRSPRCASACSPTGDATEAELDALRAEIEAAVDGGGRVRAGEPVPRPGRDRALRLPRAGRARGGALMAVATERTLSLVDAVGEAMRQAMEADPTVIVMGEDVVGGAGRGEGKENAMGGSFGATKSLYPLFGAEPRARHADLRGRLRRRRRRSGRGRAAAGRRRDVGRLHRASRSTRSTTRPAKMSYMFGGQARLPLTIRVAMGSGLSAAAQHSGTLYSIYTHLPGHQGRRALDAVRREGPAARVDLRRQPRASSSST